MEGRAPLHGRQPSSLPNGSGATRPERLPADADVPTRSRRGFKAGWPLSVLCLGFPLWWALGVSAFILPLMAVPMGLELLRRRSVHVPRGFGLWLLFLVWVAAGVFVLWADAPGAIPGGESTRIVSFGLRLAYYAAITVVFLYIGNLSERELSTSRVTRLFAFLFLVSVGGGYLGLIAPHFEFTSPVEYLLPGSLANNAYVQDLVHPSTAQIQTFLGYEEARPKAPFSYTNEWGANIALFMPFFVVSWLRRGAGWRRPAGALVLAASIVPIIYSLNRGVWLGLVVAALYVIIRLAAAGKVLALQALLVGALVGGGVVASTPLLDLATLRLDTPHSNEGRLLLAQETLRSAAGSPVVGYGTTRDVQGNLDSAAVTASEACPLCGSPPFGTHGHLYRVVFTNGYVGTALFLGFFLVRFARHWRDRDPVVVATCTIGVMFALFLLFYNLLAFPLLTLMAGLALAWRLHARPAGTTEQGGTAAQGGTTEQGRTTQPAVDPAAVRTS